MLLASHKIRLVPAAWVGAFFLPSIPLRGTLVLIAFWNSPLRKTELENMANNRYYDFYFSLLLKPPALLAIIIDFPENSVQSGHIDSLRKQHIWTVCLLYSSCDSTLLQFIHFSTRTLHGKWIHNVEAPVCTFVSQLDLQNPSAGLACVWIESLNWEFFILWNPTLRV
jgi:hypothetical protein